MLTSSAETPFSHRCGAERYAITPQFETLIGAKRLESLNSHLSSVYGLDEDFRISYLNPAWFIFSEENGNGRFSSAVWSLGINIFDCIPDVLQGFYRDLFETALKESEEERLIPTRSEYECSSPEKYRRFSMHLYSVGRKGIMVVHSLLVEEAHSSPAAGTRSTFCEEQYVDADGFVCQCANCRRIQRRDRPGQWDWVPSYVGVPFQSISHGLCSPCVEHYYPDDGETLLPPLPQE